MHSRLLERTEEEEQTPLWMMPGPLPGAQLMSCLPMGAHGCGLVLRTAEPQRSLLGSLGKPGGDRRRRRGWGSFSHPKSLRLGPEPFLAPNHRGLGSMGPNAGFSSLPMSLPVPLVTSVCLHPCLYFLLSLGITFFSLCLCLRALLFLYLFSFCLCLLSLMNSVSRSLLFFSCALPVVFLLYVFLSCPQSPPHLHLCPASAILSLPPSPNSPNLTCHKREKRKKKIKTQKSQTKTNLECVAKCCVLLVASVCVPVARSLPACPCPSAVCPARLPLLLMTRSSVPGCLVMVIGDNV